jgi:hypothetical protein
VRETVRITKPVSIIGLGRSARIVARGGKYDLIKFAGVEGFSIRGVTLDGGSPDGSTGTLLASSTARM